MARFFLYEFSDGATAFLSPGEAAGYAETFSVKVVKDGADLHRKSPKTRVRDGFQSGWNPGLGEYVGGQRDYAKKLNAKGLVEAGKEKIDQTEKTTSYFDKDTCKELHTAGMTDSAIDSIAD